MPLQEPLSPCVWYTRITTPRSSSSGETIVGPDNRLFKIYGITHRSPFPAVDSVVPSKEILLDTRYRARCTNYVMCCQPTITIRHHHFSTKKTMKLLSQLYVYVTIILKNLLRKILEFENEQISEIFSFRKNRN